MGPDGEAEIEVNQQPEASETKKPEASPKAEESAIKPLYRGLWAEEIEEGDTIPVGGSIFSDDLDIMLEVDTSWMAEKADKFTKERVDEVYESKNKAIFEPWIETNGIKIDAETFHKLLQVQTVARQLLKVGDESVAKQRKDMYLSGNKAKLSDFVGNSECAEQAVVGKMLLDKLGIKSTFMEGVHVDGKDFDPNDHAFLLLEDTQGDGSLIFDISRPKASVSGYPRILRTKDKIEYSTFEGKNNYVVPAVDIYNGTTLYYGVGHSSLMQDVNFAE